MAALCVAFGMSLVYLLQDGALKSKRPRLLEVLPSLEVCDRVGYDAVLWGFPLLTLGILTGALWSASVHERLFRGGAKQTFSVLAWIVFAAVLYFRIARGFRGRKSAYLTIAGFALGLLTLLGMKP
jgi:ABC-type transport system involved in cytochrome c biogenesis permease subunit